MGMVEVLMDSAACDATAIYPLAAACRDSYANPIPWPFW